MDVVYATLIMNGYRKFKDIPSCIKERVRKCLIALGFPELAEEGDE